MPMLAVHGGTAIAPVPKLRWPIWGEEERRLLEEVLECGKWWRGAYEDAAGSKVGQFEEAFARFQDAKHAVAVTNGTTALECAFKAAGVEAGDEVIVPAVTFIATATAVLQLGAVPIFADVDPQTYTVDPHSIEAMLTERTRCIAIVDYAGMPCDYDAIIALGSRHGIPIVADCAHAHGSQWKGTGVGALMELGTFSFHASKQLTTGEGGMVLTNDDTLAERAFSYHHIGRVKGRPFYEHHVPASNLRMTEWQGAIGLAQLTRLPAQTEARERNARYLDAGLAKLNRDGIGVAPLYRDKRVTRRGYFFYCFKFLADQWDGINREQFFRALRAEGVPCVPGHTEALYQNPLFLDAAHAFGRTGFPVRGHTYRGQPLDYSQMRCPEVERIFTTEAIRLPHAFLLGSTGNMDVVLSAIDKLWRHQAELRTVEGGRTVG